MQRALISTLFLTVFTVSAYAQTFTSPAYIQQVDASSAAIRTTTSELMQPIVDMVAQMPTLRPTGPGNLGLVWQQGIGNQGTVSQFGNRNVGLIQQIGLNNVATIAQRGIGHQAMISQQGRDNVAIIRQR